MRRSDLFIKLTTAALFIAVASYIGVRVYNAAANTYQSAAAIGCFVEETGLAEGYIVREERVVRLGGGETLAVAEEGKKVSAGQIIAVKYDGADALRRASELRDIELKIAQLELGTLQSETLSEKAYGSVLELSRVIRSGGLVGLDAATMQIESYILSGGEGEELLPSLRGRRDTLKAGMSGEMPVYAPVSGVFSKMADGFESVKPEKLEGITPSGLDQLFNAPLGELSGVYKLVTGITWYYAAVMDRDDAARLIYGNTVTVRLSGSYPEFNMTVMSIGRGEDGKCVALLSCDEGVPDIVNARAIRAEIVFKSYSGIRVPKEAIRLDDDGVTFVLLRSGAKAERADVTIISELGDGYVVGGASLREGAEIIVRANNIEDGKVLLD